MNIIITENRTNIKRKWMHITGFSKKLYCFRKRRRIQRIGLTFLIDDFFGAGYHFVIDSRGAYMCYIDLTPEYRNHPSTVHFKHFKW